MKVLMSILKLKIKKMKDRKNIIVLDEECCDYDCPMMWHVSSAYMDGINIPQYCTLQFFNEKLNFKHGSDDSLLRTSCCLDKDL